jgi:hypothetical protein
MKNSVMIGAAVIRDELLREQPPTLKEKARRAYALAFEPNGPCFACSNDDDRFRAATAGLMVAVDEEERAKIETECRFISAISSLSTGILSVVPGFPEGFEPIGLYALFTEAKEACDLRFRPPR